MMSPPLSDEEKAGMEEFVRTYLAGKEAQRAQDEYARLRESHADLLDVAAAVVALVERGMFLPNGAVMAQLKAAIAAAEKFAP